MPKLLSWIAFLMLAVFTTSAASVASAQQGTGGEQPPMPVTVVTVAASDVVLTSVLPGRVAASGVAEVRPQVSGIITERLFDEGSAVEQGAPLYRIDPASYEAAKAAAATGLAQAEAQQRAAVREEERQKELRERNVTSQQVLDDAISAVEIAEAAVKVAEAQVLAATIDIESLREHRSRCNHNTWVDVRTEGFKQIYENPVYPANQFPSGRPPKNARSMARASLR